jgi:hypothetical protein
MKKRFSLIAVLACLVGMVIAQDNPDSTAHPGFTTLPQHGELGEANGKQLTQWNGSFTDLTSHKIDFTMVGTDPSRTNTTTTVKVLIVPVKVVFPKGVSGGPKTFNPKMKLADGKSVIERVMSSPLFNSGIDFKQGKTDLGNTQYIDAFQRGMWWKYVSKNSKYHVILKPTVAAEQTITCNDPANCSVQQEWTLTGLIDINLFDQNLQSFMSNLQVTPDVFPLFVTYDTYETSGGCCIGGYHSANAGQPTGQTYGSATYVDQVGAFSQDVSALSHEIGEWMDDPFVDNYVRCSDYPLMEVGDALEGEHNFGDYPYKLNGFTYNLQSLLWIDYFGDSPRVPANGWYSFQNDMPHVCPGE